MPDPNPELVGLSFVDLLYAVPVAALANTVAETQLRHISRSGWADIFLALFALTLGWIGHHSNRQRKAAQGHERPFPPKPFTELHFLQFWAEVSIIGVYFALSVRLLLPGRAGVSASELHWKGSWLVALFVLYFVWDLLDVAIACDRKQHDWADRARHGGYVTFAFIIVFLAWRLLGPSHSSSTVAFDLVSIVLLFLYRWIQQWYIGRHEGTTPVNPLYLVARLHGGAGKAHLLESKDQADELTSLLSAREPTANPKPQAHEIRPLDPDAGKTLIDSQRTTT